MPFRLPAVALNPTRLALDGVLQPSCEGQWRLTYEDALSRGRETLHRGREWSPKRGQHSYQHLLPEVEANSEQNCGGAET
jgi:hypothetical protein